MSIKTAQTLVSEAMQEIKTISIDDAYKLSEENNCNLVDIRDKVELDKTGTIENSINIPRGLLEFQLDPNSALFQNGIIDPNKEIDPDLVIFRSVFYDEKGDSGIYKTSAQRMTKKSDYTISTFESFRKNYTIKFI